jgi:BUD22
MKSPSGDDDHGVNETEKGIKVSKAGAEQPVSLHGRPSQKRKRTNSREIEPSTSPDQEATNKKKRVVSGTSKPRSFAVKLLEEQSQLYQKLRYQGSKDLHKQIKIVKGCLCQKLIRRIKQDPAPSSTGKAKEEAKLRQLKELSVDSVVKEACERIGMNRIEAPHDRPELEVDETSGFILKDQDSSLAAIVENILQHKRLVDCMEKWSAQITKYQQWCYKNRPHSESTDEDDNDGDPICGKRQKSHQDSDTMNRDKSKQAKLKANRGGGSIDKHDGHGRDDLDSDMAIDSDEDDLNDGGKYRSQFVRLGGGDVNDDEQVKKNRPGQRARKAKAMAIEAKQNGVKLDKSINWRAPKPQQNTPADLEPRAPPATTRKSLPADTQSARAAVTTETGHLHPSWEAKKLKQTPGIVAFQGKKITFDD